MRLKVSIQHRGHDPGTQLDRFRECLLQVPDVTLVDCTHHTSVWWLTVDSKRCCTELERNLRELGFPADVFPEDEESCHDCREMA